MKKVIPVFVFTILLFACSEKPKEKVINVFAEDYDLVDAPVYVDFDMKFFDGDFEVCLYYGDNSIPGQVENLSGDQKRIWWLANVPKGESVTYYLRGGNECIEKSFTWGSISEHSSLLSYGEQPVVQYEHPVFHSDSIEETKKPFHHVYDPQSGKLLTKGLGGRFPHHRGIFLGFNHVYVNDSDESLDIWHARDGERSEHIEKLVEFSGPVMGGHIVRIHWKDKQGVPFLEERREIRVFRQSGGEILIDFISILSTDQARIRLEGDLQHAGVQFRAAQQVADSAHLTSFIRPSDWAHLDVSTELSGEDLLGLPWNAMNFIIDGMPYTVAYMSHPSNSDYSEMSERVYGRFGEFFPTEVTPEKPVTLHYRFWVKAGDKPSANLIERHYQAFANLPQITVADK